MFKSAIFIYILVSNIACWADCITSAKQLDKVPSLKTALNKIGGLDALTGNWSGTAYSPPDGKHRSSPISGSITSEKLGFIVRSSAKLFPIGPLALCFQKGVFVLKTKPKTYSVDEIKAIKANFPVGADQIISDASKSKILFRMYFDPSTKSLIVSDTETRAFAHLNKSTFDKNISPTPSNYNDQIEVEK